jgi:DNA-binding CsgD family transcriptional regulator
MSRPDVAVRPWRPSTRCVTLVAETRQESSATMQTSTPPPSIAAPTVLERDGELAALDAATVRLTDHGVGGVLVLAAGAGLGKTTVLDAAYPATASHRAAILRASPGPLERRFAYGVLRTLLEPVLWSRSPAERERVTLGPAAKAGALLVDGVMPGPDAGMAMAHSTLRMLEALAREEPMILVVDDAHWADRQSLEVLAYVARRSAHLRSLLVVAHRDEDPDAATDLLSMLAAAPGATLLRPRPLTLRGATRLIRAVAPEAPMSACQRCQRAAAGNPWLLGELGRQLHEHGEDALTEQDPSLPVGALAREVVRLRLATLSPEARAFAVALAVLGTDGAHDIAAAVAEIEPAAVAPARDELASAGLVSTDRRTLVHALIGAAILDDLPAARRSALHRLAADRLELSGAALDVVASHLMRCAPKADGRVTSLLQRAAGNAWEQGNLHTATAYLERALEERAESDPRAALLSQLSTYSWNAGLPGVRERFMEALEVVEDLRERIRILERLATLEVAAPTGLDLDDLLAAELASRPDHDQELRVALELAAIDVLFMVPGRQAELARRAAALEPAAITDPLRRRSALAQQACVHILQGSADAATTTVLAREALAGTTLLENAHERSGFHLAVRSLVHANDVERAAAGITALREEGKRRGSPRPQAAADLYGADLAERVGDVHEAERLARSVLDLTQHEPLNMFSGGALAVLIAALAERGAFDDADRTLAEHGMSGQVGGAVWDAGILHARAQLELARGDFDAAHANATRAGEMRIAHGRPNPTITPWRSTAALALAYRGRGPEAVALADEELALAERWGAPHPVLVALRSRIVAEADHEARLRLCDRALELDVAPAATVWVLLEQGASLARCGRRMDAREPLRRALALASDSGAVLAAERARRELVATGARPRRDAVEGTDALTPRQRQIAVLAAAGASNRAIADQLFLSVKTVETHLATVFQKLAVGARSDIAARLTTD